MMNWLGTTSFGIDEILKVLPHRYPFLLIDKVLEVKTAIPLSIGMSEEEINQGRKGSFVRALKNITINEMPFLGHFPDYPIFPGVLTIEAIAQASAFITVPFIAAANQGHLPPLKVMLAAVDSVRFRKPVRPGDQLMIKVTTTHARGKLWGFHGEVFTEDKLAAEGDFLAQLTTT